MGVFAEKARVPDHFVPGDFAEDFQRKWAVLPFDKWDCASEEWMSVQSELENSLLQLLSLSGKSTDIPDYVGIDDMGYRTRGIGRAVETWLGNLFNVCELGMNAESMSAITKLILGAEPKLLNSLGIKAEDARIFMRAAAELSYPESEKLQDECSRQAAPARQIDAPQDTMATHIVFHDVMEATDKHRIKQLEPFTELVGVPLPVIGRPDTGALAQLRRDCPWMEPVIRVLERQIEGMLLGWSGFQLSPLLLVGPPGAGKSWFVHHLGELFELPVIVINAAGSADNMALKGAARGWGSERPGMLVQFIAKNRAANPLVVVDEIDKVAEGRQNGNILDTLHQLLEPENARQWRDEFLLGHCDLSRVNWIATANGIAHLPPSLLSRFQVIEVPAPGKEHRPQMLHSVLRQIARERQTGFDIAAWLDDAEWQFLLDRGKTPRLMRRLAEALLGYKIREIRQRLH